MITELLSHFDEFLKSFFVQFCNKYLSLLHDYLQYLVPTLASPAKTIGADLAQARCVTIGFVRCKLLLAFSHAPEGAINAPNKRTSKHRDGTYRPLSRVPTEIPSGQPRTDYPLLYLAESAGQRSARYLARGHTAAKQTNHYDFYRAPF
jgi:hypothetical protein